MLQPSQDQLYRMKDFISKRLGLKMQPHQDALLMEHMQRQCRCKHYESVEHYINELFASSWCDYEPIVLELCDAVTIGESYFFRDQKQMQFLFECFFPELIAYKQQHNEKVIRIVSAGCSAGQELYSSIIMLDQLLPDLEEWQLDAIGIDICTEALDTARSGHYGSFSFRGMSDAVKLKYFEAHSNDDFEIISRIKKKARFHQANIKDYFEQASCVGGVDLLFCRNVFIYLEYQLAQEIVKSMVQCVTASGILLLGPSDIMHDSIEGAQTCQAPGMIYYKRLQNEQDVEADAIFKAQEVCVDQAWPDVDEGMSDAVKNQINAEEPTRVELQNLALKLAAESEYEAAFDVIERCICLDELDCGSYYLKGLICMEMRAFDDAKAQFKSAIFLKADFEQAQEMMKLCQLCMQAEEGQLQAFMGESGAGYSFNLVDAWHLDVIDGCNGGEKAGSDHEKQSK